MVFSAVQGARAGPTGYPQQPGKGPAPLAGMLFGGPLAELLFERSQHTMQGRTRARQRPDFFQRHDGPARAAELGVQHGPAALFDIETLHEGRTQKQTQVGDWPWTGRQRQYPERRIHNGILSQRRGQRYVESGFVAQRVGKQALQLAADGRDIGHHDGHPRLRIRLQHLPRPGGRGADLGFGVAEARANWLRLVFRRRPVSGTAQGVEQIPILGSQVVKPGQDQGKGPLHGTAANQVGDASTQARRFQPTVGGQAAFELPGPSREGFRVLAGRELRRWEWQPVSLHQRPGVHGAEGRFRDPKQRAPLGRLPDDVFPERSFLGWVQQYGRGTIGFVPRAAQIRLPRKDAGRGPNRKAPVALEIGKGLGEHARQAFAGR